MRNKWESCRMVIRVPALCLLDAVLVSFDVVSVFTNVPVDLAIRIAGDRLRDDFITLRPLLALTKRGWNPPILLPQCDIPGIPREDFFQQTFGTAIGSPVSVTVADLVMEDVEQRALSTYHFPPPFWKRYVDDTCTTLAADKVHSFHDHLIQLSYPSSLPLKPKQKGSFHSWTPPSSWWSVHHCVSESYPHRQISCTPLPHPQSCSSTNIVLQSQQHMLLPDGEGCRGEAYLPCLKEQWVPIRVHHKTIPAYQKTSHLSWQTQSHCKPNWCETSSLALFSLWYTGSILVQWGLGESNLPKLIWNFLTSLVLLSNTTSMMRFWGYSRTLKLTCYKTST